tara:strand:- start:832 stop:1197 length:366 start_codon:yes stop_codon:yes gene_type:complete
MSNSASKSGLPSVPNRKSSKSPIDKKARLGKNRKISRGKDPSDVLVSAVISSYLLTHLHHVLQRAEFGAVKDGKILQAENFAQLRKVLCMDARSMQDASARGSREGSSQKFNNSKIVQNVA